MPTPSPAGEYVSTTEVARLAATTRSTVTRWIADGRLPAYRFGRNFKIRRDDVEAFMAAAQVGGDR